MESKQQTITPYENLEMSFHQRAKAFLVDFMCGILIPSVIVQAFVGQLMPDDASVSSEIVAGFFIFLFFVTYWIVVPYVSNGQTIGKWIFGLRIVSCTSERLSFWQLMVRTLGYVVSAMKFVQMRSGDFDSSGTLSHDIRARTQVIIKKKHKS